MADASMTPTSVYDVHDNWPPKGGRWIDDWMAWLRLHGVEPNDTYRVEFHTIGAPLIRVFQYEPGPDGRLRIDPITRTAVMREPYDVPIRCEPPRPEDYR